MSSKSSLIRLLMGTVGLTVACGSSLGSDPARPSSADARQTRAVIVRADLKPPPVPAQSEQEAEPREPAEAQFEVYGSVARDWGERQTSTAPVKTVRFGTKLKVKWTAPVGQTTFRTTMALVGDTIVIGTHGTSLNGQNERDDGVHLLDAATGGLKRLIPTPGRGDRDVGGVAVDGQRVYFTTDNGLIVAVALDGTVAWTAKGSGKVRPAPALGDLNRDGQVDVVVGDEHGLLYALDGKSGQKLWRKSSGTNEYGAKGYIGAAAIADLDGDGNDDVVAGARDGVLVAYEGKSGRVVWQAEHTSGIHASPVVADFDHDGAPEVMGAWSYGDVAVYDGKTGELRWGTTLRQDDGGIEGLFGTPTPLSGRPGVLIVPTAWWGEKEDGVIGVGVDQREFKAFEGRVSASAVVTDLDGDGVSEAILGTEAGNVIALNADGSYAKLATLRGPIEAPAMLADVDGDGTIELLVASNDGSLTCFETGSHAKPDVSRFRGDSHHNRGDLGRVSLGWRSSAAVRSPQGAASRGTIRIDYLRCCRELQEEATRAPTPQNQYLLRAASVCSMMAADGRSREAALKAIRQTARDAGVPAACR